MGVLTVSRNTHDGSIALDDWYGDGDVLSWISYAWREEPQFVYALELCCEQGSSHYDLFHNWRTDDDAEWHFNGHKFIGQTVVRRDATPDDIRAAFEILWQRLEYQLSIPKD